MDYDIVSDFTQDYQRAYMLLNTYYAEAYRDVGFYLGNQWSLDQLNYLNNERRNSFTFNKARKLIDTVSGYVKSNQQASVVVALENSNEQTADQLTELLRHVMQPVGYRIHQRACHASLCSGLAWVSPWIDYRSDYVNGQICFHLDQWNDVIFDPFTTRADLEDCTFVARRKYLSKDVIKSLVPGCEKEIDAMGYGNRDEKFTYEPYARQWGLQELLAYNEYWKQRYRKGWLLVDTKTGEQRPWKGNQAKLELMQAAFPHLRVIEGYHRTIEYNVIVENRLLYSGEDPWGIGEYPFVPYFCVFNPSYDLFQWKIQSLIRIIRDPQEEYNMRKSKLLDMVDSQIGSGWKVKSGAVSNPKSLFQTGQGKVIFFNPGFEVTDAERIPPPSVPESLFALPESFDRDMGEMVDLGNITMDNTDRMSSVLFQMKQSMSIMGLGEIFDHFKEAQTLLSRKVLKMIQNYTPEKVMRIIKQEPTPEFYNKTFLNYDVDIVDAVLSASQKQMAFLQAWSMRAAGANVPDDLLFDLAPFPIANKFREQLQAQQKAAEAQAQAEAADREQVNMLLKSKAVSDLALAEERINRVKYDAALSEERIAASQEERSRSVLDIVRAAKEFDQMDVDQSLKIIDMMHQIQDRQKAEAEQVKDKQEREQERQVPTIEELQQPQAPQ